MTSIWRENIHGYLSADIILFQDANSYPTAKLEEKKCSLIRHDKRINIPLLYQIQNAVLP